MLVIWYNPETAKFEYAQRSVFQRLRIADPAYGQTRVMYVFPYNLSSLVRRLCRELNSMLHKDPHTEPFS